MKKHKWLFAVLMLYLAVLLRITVFRSSFLASGWCNGQVEWIPFVYLLRLLDVGYYSYFIYLFVGNIIWFVPLGVYIGIQKGSLIKAILLGFLLSVAIEAGQYIFSTGVTEVEDVILNTFGCLLGCIPFHLFKKES